MAPDAAGLSRISCNIGGRCRAGRYSVPGCALCRSDASRGELLRGGLGFARVAGVSDSAFRTSTVGLHHDTARAAILRKIRSLL